ncbi:MAG: glycosyltransferase, partial [Flavitalea sp.]
MISIIIPTYNEADQIAQTINKTCAANGNEEVEVIVVDGGSIDDTRGIAKNCGAQVVLCERKGRAAQMNVGATLSKGEILYFLHADSIPPKDFATQIINAHNKGAVCGCFRLAFDNTHWFLRANAWFTRFNVNAVRFGDQSLFVARHVFLKSGGFNERLL